jgi:ATP-dependent DNA helicase DinG
LLAKEKFHPDAVAEMRRVLAETGSPESVEVLWVGRVDGEGMIVEVSAAASGDATMVPALFPHMSRGDAVIHNHPGGDLRPSGADLNIASRLGNAGIGFLIVNDDISQVNVIAAPIPRKELILLDVEELSSVLEPDGALSEYMAGYEPRWEQIDLLQMVAASFNSGSPVLAEAGTGVGKSFAYLIPAIRWAADNDERIVISTATIALQQQLMEKDIPFVIDLLGTAVKVALVKGRGNYLCLKKLEEAADDDELFSTGDGLEGLKVWAGETATGSRSDIPFRPAESDWGRIRCEADSCPGSFCAHFDKCFLMKARRKAAEASVLVANHHLLFADLAARRDGAGPDETVVLPPYKRIILDEAHHAESSATDLFSASLSLPSLQRIFTRLLRRKGQSSRGLLPRLAARFPMSSEKFIGEIPPLIDAARGRAETLDALGRDVLAGAAQIRLKGESGDLERTRLEDPMSALRKALSDLVGRLADSIRDLAEDDADPDVEALAVESRQTCAVLQEAVSVADAFLHRDEYPDQVFWLESFRRSDGNQWLACHKTPLSVADVVREAVWEPFGTVVGVSATLAVGGDFHHWKSRIGAERIPRKPLEGIFPSPFDFASRVLLGVPTDGPSPEQPEEWESFLIEAISSMVDLSGGHALVLFTAYSTLRKTLSGVRERLGSDGPLLLAQGDDDRGRLLKRFREEESSVLFATDSFWEGVDVPGEALKLVIITRLPFRPPTDPVSEARREAIAAAGGNPFYLLTLPEAVTRFRQGFGRLMRRSDDRGSVLVLDPRVIRKRYGSLFLDSLPRTARSIKTMDGVLRDLEDFLFP